ncbi:unnamed protein product [Effrenium voratum]|uniref:Uncharacterized protein n=1 Tax=Effrenium voratum TaxID=2562239 RepID=A0AA36J194_9DINO|nr:unnamed protein product [Effrenium voratum]
MQMKLDKFTNVKKAMDDMVFALKKEQEDEVKQKDFCIAELRETQLQSEDKTRSKEALLAKEQAIDLEKPKSEMETLQGEIAEMQKQLQLAGQNREKENTEFQKVVEEQRQTATLLKQALQVLGKFYNKGAFVQGSAVQPKAPGGFKDYQANGKSFGVMSMLQQLVDDTTAMEAEAVRAEKSAQTAYEAFAKDTTESITAKEMRPSPPRNPLRPSSRRRWRRPSARGRARRRSWGPCRRRRRSSMKPATGCSRTSRPGRAPATRRWTL